MDTVTILKIVSIVLGIVVGTIIPFIVSFRIALKKRKEAKKEAELAKTEAEKAEAEKKKAEANNEIAELAKGFIVEAENLYSNVDALVKQQGGTCGAQKKDSVMTKILRTCIDKKNDFDEQYWSNYVDEFVAATRKVNVKK